MSDKCCESAAKPVTREDVRDFYGDAARTPQAALCCANIYTPGETAHIPPEVLEVSYGCGSPVMKAELAAGEVHVDLGSGGGIDCFIAAKLVGPSGRVIGIDMTPDMIQRARGSAAKVATSLGYGNVEFHSAFLEELPLPDASADLITSNCVVNLASDKRRVLAEAFRVLKPGGRFVIADVVSEGPLPAAITTDKQLWGECLAGALTEDDFFALAAEVGFCSLEQLDQSFYKEAAGARFWSVTVRGWKAPVPQRKKACC
jgi:SAM-dependent methyltransferase